MLIILILYGLTLCGLAVYVGRLVLLSLYVKHQTELVLPDVAEADLPTVTVQRPIYNQKNVPLRPPSLP